MRKSAEIELVMPYLANSNNPYIEYRCYCPATGKLERYRHYKGLAKLKGAAREKAAARIIMRLTAQLQTGWRPWNDGAVVYRDEIQYFQISSNFGKAKKDADQLRRLFSEWLLFKKPGLSIRSYESYQSKIRVFYMWLDENGYSNLLLSQISEEIIRKFFLFIIEVRRFDKVTVKEYRRLVKAMFIYFSEKRYIKEMPVKNMPNAPKRVDNAARPIFDKHMIQFLQAAKERDSQLFLAAMLQYFLLIRPNYELRLLKVQDIDLARRRVYIPDNQIKTTGRYTTIPNALAEIIIESGIMKFPMSYYVFGPDGQPGKTYVPRNSFYRRFRSIADDLNFPRIYKFYSFKHTGAGTLLESGATIAELMNQLGHKNIESTFHYIRKHYGEQSEKVLNLKPSFLDKIN